MAFSPFRGTPAQLGPRGAVGSHVKVLGLPKAVAKLKGVDAAIRLDLGLLMKGAAEFVEKRAQEYVPVVTHNLQHGIKLEKQGSYTYDVTASSRAGDISEKNDKEYAGFVEFGWSGHPEGAFFMTRAFNDARPIVANELQAIARRLERL
jgi:hypothetical protein